MGFAQRIASLEHQRAEAEALLQEEVSHPWQNDSKVTRLKVRKLRLRDEISRLQSRDERNHALIHCRSDTS